MQKVRTAIEQVLRDQPVDTDALPKPQMEADEARWLEATHRAEQMRKESERIAKEFGLTPEEIRPIRTEGPPAQRAGDSPPPPESKGAEPARPEADPLAMAADQFADSQPELKLTVGRDADGEPQTMTARQYLDNVRENAAQAREDAQLFEIAAQCLLGRS